MRARDVICPRPGRHVPKQTSQSKFNTQPHSDRDFHPSIETHDSARSGHRILGSTSRVNLRTLCNADRVKGLLHKTEAAQQRYLTETPSRGRVSSRYRSLPFQPDLQLPVSKVVLSTPASLTSTTIPDQYSFSNISSFHLLPVRVVGIVYSHQSTTKRSLILSFYV